MNRLPSAPNRATHRPVGFTLVEVMISIAIALILILGISQIFSMAQRTTGAGNTILAADETTRAVHQTFVDDFRAIANGTDSPGMFIVSQPVAAFRTRQDMLDNRKATGGLPDPRQANDPVKTGSLAAYLIDDVNSRIHRTDRMGFFMRDRFTRQTGNSASPFPLTSITTSDEAFAWIGHLALPNNDKVKNWIPGSLVTNSPNGYLNPGSSNPTTVAPNTNDNNFFASDWVLGREVVLMKPAGTEVGFNGPNPSAATNNGLSILVAGNKAVGIPLYMARYDLAYTTMDLYRSWIAPSTTWWQDLSGIRSTSVTAITLDRRYCGNPFLVKPAPTFTNKAQWLSAAVAQTSPLFVRGCSQFIVEFAGNFTTQDQNSDPGNANFGQITAVTPDPSGKLDFIPQKDGAGHWTRRIRWYGFPRDSDGVGAANINALHGVLPLAWVVNGIGSTTAAAAFERVFPPDHRSAVFQTGPSPTGATGPAATRYTATPYVCAWGPDTDKYGIPRPKMIRIIMAIDDPTGHLNNEQTYEYVYNLP